MLLVSNDGGCSPRFYWLAANVALSVFQCLQEKSASVDMIFICSTSHPLTIRASPDSIVVRKEAIGKSCDKIQLVNVLRGLLLRNLKSV